MSRRKNKQDDSTASSVSFNIVGNVAELFERVRSRARDIPEFWTHSRLTKADFARFLLTKSLVDMAKDLDMDLGRDNA